MQIARVAVDGTTYRGTVHGDEIETDDGVFALNDVDVLAPCEPTKVVAAGKNYVDHVAEMGGDGMPDFPFLFLKPSTSVVGQNDQIVYPDGADIVHYEGELAVVIGESCRNVAPGEARDYLEGYTCLNDVSWRDWSGKEDQWVRHKGVDTFCPIGPYIETDVPEHVDVETWLNGDRRQHANTDGMYYSVAGLVSEASQYMTLKPGDVIATGTPQGVGELHPGDVVEVQVGDVGRLRNEVVSESDSGR